MTKEEKELLLKDLCARLPYGVKGLHRGQVHKLFTIDGREVNGACIQVDGYNAWFPVETFKPYLRPMSSMTEEENKEFGNCVTIYDDVDIMLSHHLDCRGLIEKGLALEALEGMYESKNNI